MTKAKDFSFQVDSLDALVHGILLGQNAMLPQYEIHCTNVNRLGTAAPIQLMQDTVGYISKFVSGFPRSQLQASSYSYRHFPMFHKASITIDKQYMCKAKETQDLRCVAAEIGSLLKAQLGETMSFSQAVRGYQQWINRYFRYEKTGQIHDHSAIGLLSQRKGVCQAIAALTILIFPYLGFPVYYVSGEGFGRQSWEAHGWNVIKSEKGWVHVDFTFGMSGLHSPNTGSMVENYSFRKNHRWDEGLYTNEILTANELTMARMRACDISLRANDKSFCLGNVTVTTDKALMLGNDITGHFIDMAPILALLGGGCEYLPEENSLRICLGNGQKLLTNAQSYMTGPAGYVSVSLLKEIALIEGGSHNSISFTMKL